MSNWRHFLDEEFEDESSNFQKIKRGQKKTEEDKKTPKKQTSVKHTIVDSEQS